MAGGNWLGPADFGRVLLAPSEGRRWRRNSAGEKSQVGCERQRSEGHFRTGQGSSSRAITTITHDGTGRRLTTGIQQSLTDAEDGRPLSSRVAHRRPRKRAPPRAPAPRGPGRLSESVWKVRPRSEKSEDGRPMPILTRAQPPRVPARADVQRQGPGRCGGVGGAPFGNHTTKLQNRDIPCRLECRRPILDSHL